MKFRSLHSAPLVLVLLVGGAQAAVVQVDESAFSGFELRLGFEEFIAATDEVSTQFAGLGVTFNDDINRWIVEPHTNYGTALANFALGAGAGANGLLHRNNNEEILFDPPVTRVGFLFGSSHDVDVPITVSRGGVGTPFHLVVAENQLAFFGFEDAQGIDKIAFGNETNDEFVSQLDELRFEWEPGGSVTRIGLGDFSGSEALIGFEDFTANTDVVSNQFAGAGLTFFNQTDGGWPVEPHSDYGTEFVDVALDAGAGDNALFHQGEGDGEEIRFDPPVTRVGFLFGSNVDVRVPVAISRGGVPTGSMPIVVPGDTLRLFAFEDAGGIDEIAFGAELNGGSVSQLDQLRFEPVPEPSGALLSAVAAVALAARVRGFVLPGRARRSSGVSSLA
jgi:hypothetical protein